MSKKNAKEIENNNKRKKKVQSAGRLTVRIIAALMAISMVFAVAATCIFYIQYYI